MNIFTKQSIRDANEKILTERYLREKGYIIDNNYEDEYDDLYEEDEYDDLYEEEGEEEYNEEEDEDDEEMEEEEEELSALMQQMTQEGYKKNKEDRKKYSALMQGLTKKGYDKKKLSALMQTLVKQGADKGKKKKFSAMIKSCKSKKDINENFILSSRKELIQEAITKKGNIKKISKELSKVAPKAKTPEARKKVKDLSNILKKVQDMQNKIEESEDKEEAKKLKKELSNYLKSEGKKIADSFVVIKLLGGFTGLTIGGAVGLLFAALGPDEAPLVLNAIRKDIQNSIKEIIGTKFSIQEILGIPTKEIEGISPEQLEALKNLSDHVGVRSDGLSGAADVLSKRGRDSLSEVKKQELIDNLEEFWGQLKDNIKAMRNSSSAKELSKEFSLKDFKEKAIEMVKDFSIEDAARGALKTGSEMFKGAFGGL